MITIRYITPVFGKLPDYFQLWLDSCKTNPSIDWLVVTDDHSCYDYPSNVQVLYCSFDDIKTRIQKIYPFEITLDSAYKLVDYKVAYGEIFKEELADYDFWGFCDIDLIWGNIRRFFTDEVLLSYPKIGCQGHSTIFKNEPTINAIYRMPIDGEIGYEEVFTTNKICCTDIGFIRKRFEKNNLPIFDETIYAGLDAYSPSFFLQAMPEEDAYKNRRQVFLWNNGQLLRYYLLKGEIVEEEYYYIHFFKRPMKNRINDMSIPILIVPNKFFNYNEKITYEIVNRYGKKSKISFYLRMAYQNRKKISIMKIIEYLQFQLKHNHANRKYLN